jgi:hypothetical protein
MNRTFGCIMQARVSGMAPIFRHAARTFGLLKKKRKERFSSGSPSRPFTIRLMS